MNKLLLSEVLDLARDGGYLLHELWGAVRGRYGEGDEKSMRVLVRNAVFELLDEDYVSLSRRVGPGEYRDLEGAELSRVRHDDSSWGLTGQVAESDLTVSATAKGVAALGRGEFR
jgi:hypothetical protein